MVRSLWQVQESVCPSSVEEVVGLLLRNRGLDSSALSCSLGHLEPYLNIQGLDRGADLMAEHLAAGHEIVLVGDYDCDGITSLAQMAHFLNDIGYRNYSAIIPTRAEGYGVPLRAVQEHPGARLLVAMDCGTLDREPIARARAQGADCLVIDHHEVPDRELAPASVLINPKQPGCPSRFKEFCASGLTLLFLTRLRRALRGSHTAPNLGGKYLALATIGTISDMVPLIEGNRILAASGLCSLNAGRYLPMRQLIAAIGLSGKVLTAGHVGYYLGPRINAAGRMADPLLAFELLMTESADAIGRLVQELNQLNAKRQGHEDAILKEIRERLAREAAGRRSVVMGDPGWSHGVVGIVASRVQQELHYGPTILFAVDVERGIARGSARSVSGFDMVAALSRCDDLLVRWGGHKMAAGMTVALDRLEAFAARFEEVVQEFPEEIFVPRGRVDMEISLDLVSPDLFQALKQLEPHGLGNPTPTFAVRKTSVVFGRAFGRDQNHLRVRLDGRIDGIYWRGMRQYTAGSWQNGHRHDVIFQLEWDDYLRKPVANIKDIGTFF